MKKSVLNIVRAAVFGLLALGTTAVQAQWTGTSVNGTTTRNDRVGIGGSLINVNNWDPNDIANLIVSGEDSGGKQIFHWQSGEVGSFNFGDQWIGIGQPQIVPGNPFAGLVPAYGFRSQWNGSTAIFALGQSGDAVLQWGNDANDKLSIQFLQGFGGPGGPGGRLEVMEFNSVGKVFVGTTALAPGANSTVNAKFEAVGAAGQFAGLFRNSNNSSFVEGAGYSVTENGGFLNFGHIGTSTNNSAAVGINIGVNGFSNTTGAGSSSLNIGVFGNATGATTNFAGYFSGDILVTGMVNPSDKRLKTNVVAIRDKRSSLELLKQLRPVHYEFKSQNQLAKEGFGALNFRAGVKSGFIAQEVQKVDKNLVVEAPVVDLNTTSTQINTILTVDYMALIPHLVSAVQELSVGNRREAQDPKVEALEAEVETLETEMKGLGTELEAVKAQMARMEELMMAMMQERMADPNNNSNEIEVGKLEQNRPNPFTNSTRIGYELPASAQNGRLIVYDLQGTQVAEFTNLNAGRNSVTLEGNSLQAGIYLYSLMVDGKVVSVKRMVLTR